MKISSLKDLHKFTNKISEIILPGDYLFLIGEIGLRTISNFINVSDIETILLNYLIIRNF